MEANEQRSRRSNALGPTGELVAANVALLRANRGLSTTQLSKLLERLGRPIPPTGITKIEKRTRRVDVDDLMALAAALRVSPSRLLLMSTDRPEDTIEVTGFGEVSSRDAWDWLDGVRPLRAPQPAEGTGAAGVDSDLGALLDFALWSRPQERRDKTLREAGLSGPSVD
ncbi:helix-turn-helix transcriptional regulator [Streptomyces sp. OM5714]|uniref:helix-turn-helix domain-containing protein n=1 Tax=Streptomyces sp. OM5714 TaxID=2602736 RepID=UPI0013DA9E39|nr:helix-turn-helix transcriptional regulator [Streptomyces sp. OM5714]KAF2778584.1 helix-hairpin-helix DNA-binding motif-containing protein [Streptomyces sp. OM5714]